MKKIICFLLLLIAYTAVNAQSFKVGALFSPQVNYEIGSNKENDVVPVLLAHSVLVTSKSFHLLAYAFNGEALVLTNGWLYSSNANLHLIVTKDLNINDGFLGLGWEYALKNGSASANALIQIGTNYKLDKTLINLGIVIPFTVELFKMQE